MSARHDHLIAAQAVSTFGRPIEILVDETAVLGGPKQRQPIGRVVKDRLHLGAARIQLTGAFLGELLQLLIEFPLPPFTLAQCRLGRFLDAPPSRAVDGDAAHNHRMPTRISNRLAEKYDPVNITTGPNCPQLNPHRGHKGGVKIVLIPGFETEIAEHLCRPFHPAGREIPFPSTDAPRL